MGLLSLLVFDPDEKFLTHVVTTVQHHYAHRLFIAGATRCWLSGLIQARTRQPDVILLDPVAPSVTRFNLVERFNTCAPRAIVIGLAPRDTVNQRRLAHAAGVTDYVPRAALATDLLPTIWWQLRLRKRNPLRNAREFDRVI